MACNFFICLVKKKVCLPLCLLNYFPYFHPWKYPYTFNLAIQIICYVFFFVIKKSHYNLFVTDSSPPDWTISLYLTKSRHTQFSKRTELTQWEIISGLNWSKMQLHDTEFIRNTWKKQNTVFLDVMDIIPVLWTLIYISALVGRPDFSGVWHNFQADFETRIWWFEEVQITVNMWMLLFL